MAGLSPYEDLPEAMVLYYASRLTKVSKHVNGRQGQKYRARARRRGAWGKACRRRALARQRLALTSRVAAATATRLGATPDGFTYDEAVPF